LVQLRASGQQSEREAGKPLLLEADTRERLVKTKQAEKALHVL
jgi:hypothetical protein